MAATDGLELLARAGRGSFASTLWVEGPDEALKAVFLAALRRAWAAAVPTAPAARVMRPGEDSVDEILAAFLGISMFTTRELTLVLDVEDFGISEKRVAALADGISRPAGDSVLVLVETASEKPRKSLDPLRAACTARFDGQKPDARALLGWGRRQLEAESLTAEPGVLEALAERCEGETLAYFNELWKLTVWGARAGRVTKADLEALAQPVIGAAMDEYLLAVATGDGALAVRRLGRLLAAGESEGGVMWALGNLAGAALGGGWSPNRAQAAALGRRRSPRDLARALDAVYRAEAAWKGGRLDPLTALERATREVAGS